MILVISHAKDEHAQAVLAELGKLGASATLLDLSDVPQRVRLAVYYDGARSRSLRLHRVDAPSLDLTGAVPSGGDGRNPLSCTPRSRIRRSTRSRLPRRRRPSPACGRLSTHAG